ncbi:hypothetical protein GCM10023083_28050 [Streptomyces phyllanthi]
MGHPADQLTRFSALRGLGVGTATLGAGPLLAACSADLKWSRSTTKIGYISPRTGAYSLRRVRRVHPAAGQGLRQRLVKLRPTDAIRSPLDTYRPLIECTGSGSPSGLATDALADDGWRVSGFPLEGSPRWLPPVNPASRPQDSPSSAHGDTAVVLLAWVDFAVGMPPAPDRAVPTLLWGPATAEADAKAQSTRFGSVTLSHRLAAARRTVSVHAHTEVRPSPIRAGTQNCDLQP